MELLIFTGTGTGYRHGLCVVQYVSVSRDLKPMETSARTGTIMIVPDRHQ